MVQNYFKLIQRSFGNTFKRSEYRRWYNVPSGKRLQYGLIAGAITAIAALLMSSWDMHLWGLVILVLVLIFIAIPISEYYTEKLKREYDEKEN